MNDIYNELINEANRLMSTFTIRYNFGEYGKDLYSSTYDDLSGWIRKALKQIEKSEEEGRSSELYSFVRRYRGRSGDVTLRDFKNIVQLLSNR